MSGPAGWLGRRFLALPLLLVLTAVFAVVWLVALVLTVLSSPVIVAVTHRRPRARALRVATLAAAYLIVDCLCVLACFVLWVGAGFGWRLSSPRFVRAHRTLLRAFLNTLVALADPVFGFRVQVQEPTRHPWDLLRADSDVPILVLARHAGPGASFALVHVLLSRYRRDVHVVLKDTLRLDPAIDLLLTRTGCTWIPSNKGARAGSAELVEQAAAGLRGRTALLLFPEGADWTPARHLAAVKKLRRRGLFREAREALRMPHVLPPRPAGTLAALTAAPNAPVLIFTHTGQDDLLDAAAAWDALPLRRPLQMIWWCPPERPAHADLDAVDDWLHDIWANIDAWITEQQDLDAAQNPS